MNPTPINLDHEASNDGRLATYDAYDSISHLFPFLNGLVYQYSFFIGKTIIYGRNGKVNKCTKERKCDSRTSPSLREGVLFRFYGLRHGGIFIPPWISSFWTSRIRDAPPIFFPRLLHTLHRKTLDLLGSARLPELPLQIPDRERD